MISTLQLESYRGFASYGFRGLKRVNLLVGKNNCGKTSVLEALHVLATGNDAPWVLAEHALERGEVTVRRGTETVKLFPNISHFFHGHRLAADSRFKISATSGGRVEVAVLATNGTPGAQARGRAWHIDVRVGRGPYSKPYPSGLLLRTDTDGALADRWFEDVAESERDASRMRVTRDGELWVSFSEKDIEHLASMPYLSMDSLDFRQIRARWDSVLAEGEETHVNDALRILDPTIRDIVFLSEYSGRGGIMVGHEGQQHRVPLGSHGAGMRRLLALALVLSCNADGVALIDEIDIGLHYSLLGEMWKMVVETAVRRNVQVFATTHSWDCVKGLAWLCENHPELGGEVSVQKISTELDSAVGLGAEQITAAVDSGVEVR